MPDNKTSLEQAQAEISLLQEQKDELVKRVYELSVSDRDSRSLIKLLFDQFPYGIVMMNSKRQILQVNKAAASILCVESQQMVGRSCEHIFNCYQLHQCCPIIDENKMLDQERTECIGSSKRFIRSSIVTNESDGDITILETFSDITAIDEAHQSHTLALQSKSNFLSNVSHELRTPMHGILGYCDLLESELEENNSAMELLEPIKSSAKSLWVLIERLLEAAKLEDEEIILEPALIKLQELMQPLQQEMKSMYGDDEHIMFEYPAEVDVYIDVPHVNQVLVLLLRNAVKYGDGGDIACTAFIESGSPNQLIVSVEDKGKGIPEDKHKAIFEMFEQADGSSTRSFEGVGLGLTIAKRLSHLMGGDIVLQSEKDIGSKFTLCIPA